MKTPPPRIVTRRLESRSGCSSRGHRSAARSRRRCWHADASAKRSELALARGRRATTSTLGRRVGVGPPCKRQFERPGPLAGDIRRHQAIPASSLQAGQGQRPPRGPPRNPLPPEIAAAGVYVAGLAGRFPGAAQASRDRCRRMPNRDCPAGCPAGRRRARAGCPPLGDRGGASTGVAACLLARRRPEQPASLVFRPWGIATSFARLGQRRRPGIGASGPDKRGQKMFNSATITTRRQRDRPGQMPLDNPADGRRGDGVARPRRPQRVYPHLVGHEQRSSTNSSGSRSDAAGPWPASSATPADAVGQVRAKLAHVGRLVPLVLQQLLQHGPLGKRRPAGQHEKERAAQRIDVAAHVGVARDRAPARARCSRTCPASRRWPSGRAAGFGLPQPG